MTLVQLILCGLATWQAVEIWRHGSIFSGPRAYWEARGGFLGELLGCPFCLSVWVAGVMVGVSFLEFPNPWNDSRSAIILSLLVGAAKGAFYTLAVSRVANLGNDIFHAQCRSPSRDINIEDIDNDNDQDSVNQGAEDGYETPSQTRQSGTGNPGEVPPP